MVRAANLTKPDLARVVKAAMASFNGADGTDGAARPRVLPH
jgi:hypothetical protein